MPEIVLDITQLELVVNPVSAAPGEVVGGVTDHGALSGLADDDHLQYLTVARGDARYYTETETTSLLAAKADLVGGVIPTSQIPQIAITTFLGIVANQSAMLALSGQYGDWCIRSDSGLTWVITGSDPTILGNWTSLGYPTSPVSSVNGQTGTVVLNAAAIGAATAEHNHNGVYSVVGHTHTTSGITGLGTAATLNVAASGDASSGEVVKGNDTRLTDSRSPTTHTHDDRYFTETESDARFAPITHTEFEAFYVVAPTAVDIPIFFPKAATIVSLRNLKTSAGTLTFSVSINGTPVSGLSSLSVTTTAQNPTASAAFTVAAGDTVTLSISSPSSAANLQGSLCWSAT